MRRIHALALVALLATPLHGGTIITVIAAGGGVNLVTSLFIEAHGEPATPWSTDDTQYSMGLSTSDADGFFGTEGNVFGVIGASGSLCNARVSLAGGGLDSGETATVTVRILTGGDVSGGGWADTNLVISVSPDNTSTDESWTDSDCQNVTAGDVVAVLWDWGTDVPEGGTDEAPEFSVEFRSSAANEHFQSAWIPGRSGCFGSECTWSMLGYGIEPGNGLGLGELAAFPGSYSMTGMFVTMEANPASAITIYGCEDDAGTDSNCDGAGTVRMSCQVATTGVSTCSDTTCNAGDCDFVAGDRFFWFTTSLEAGNSVSVAMRLTNTSQKWFRGYVSDVQGSDTWYAQHGRLSGTLCNAASGENACSVLLVSAMTCDAGRGYIVTALSDGDGSVDIDLREDQADSGLSGQFVQGSNVMTMSGTATFDAGDEFNLEATPVSTPSTGSNYSVTFECADITAGD